jgi:hypothetical protein
MRAALREENPMMRTALAGLVALALALVSVGCASMDDGSGYTPEELRYRCIQRAHNTIRGAGLGDNAYQNAVRDVYLRCLDSYGATDAKPASGG